MKRFLILIFTIFFILAGCSQSKEAPQIVTTTAPIYAFTTAICQGTGIQIGQLITESVSCLHDYTLQSKQMYMLESAELVLLSGLGLEEFLHDAMGNTNSLIEISSGIQPICNDSHHHEQHSHNHDEDPHIWLSPSNAAKMAENIYTTLSEYYPQYADQFQNNYRELADKFEELSEYAHKNLSDLSCRDLITFHDGFSYMAEAFNLHILKAIEEESGSESSAAELISICELVEKNKIPALFTEKNGSDAAAKIISEETGVNIYTLDMAMSETDYFEAMYQNINTLKEALE